MRNLKHAVMAALIICALPVLAHASTNNGPANPPDQTGKLYTPADVAVFLQAEGYTDAHVHKGGQVIFRLNSEDDMSITIDDNGNFEFSAEFKGARQPLPAINQWNMDNDFAHGYLKAERTAALRAFINVVNGITPRVFRVFLGAFTGLVVEYRRHLELTANYGGDETIGPEAGN